MSTGLHVVRLRTPAALALLLVLAAGCAGTPRKPTGRASIGVSISALSSADVASVKVTISAADIPTPIVQDLVHSSQGWGGVVGGIPAGAGRDFAVVAYDATMTGIYSGDAPNVTITEGQTASVVILLQQTTPPNPFADTAPVVDSLTASSSAVAPLDIVNLVVTAHDVDAGDTLTYAWTADGGTFAASCTADTDCIGIGNGHCSNGHCGGSGVADGGTGTTIGGTTAAWVAPATPGTYTITITVTDSFGLSRAVSLAITVSAANATGAANVQVSFNTWPVVSSVSASPTQIDLGQTTALVVSATDADGDLLDYNWVDTCSGSFTNGGLTDSTATWTAPATAFAGYPGSCTLTATVTDGRGGTTTGAVTIQVAPARSFVVAPVVTASSQSQAAAEVGDVVVYTATAYDPQGEALTFAWSGGTSLTLGTQSDTPSGNPTSSTETATILGFQTAAYVVTLTVTNASGSATAVQFTHPGRTINTYPAGIGPVALAFDGTYIWTANEGVNSVSKVLARSGALIGTYPIDGEPTGLAFDGSHLWVSNLSSSDVSELDINTGAVVGTYPVGGSFQSAVVFDGTNVWVANEANNNVTKLLASTGALIGTYPVGGQPQAMVFDGTNLWVVNRSDGTVSELLGSSGATVGTYSVGTAPQAITWDGINILVGLKPLYFSGTVTVLSGNNGAILHTYSTHESGNPAAPGGIAFDGTHVWVTDYSNNAVSELDINTGAIVGFYPVGTGPSAVLFDGRDIWVADQDSNQITKL